MAALEVFKLFGIDGYGRGPKEAGILVILLELGGVAGPLDPKLGLKKTEEKKENYI